MIQPADAEGKKPQRWPDIDTEGRVDRFKKRYAAAAAAKAAAKKK